MSKAVVLAIVVAATVLAGAAPAQSESADLRERFGDANALYEQGDYTGAIERYHDIEQEGVEAPDLYYNIGNAYYKTGDLGRAVLYYERALRLEPRARDARDNLALVRSQLKDKQFVTEQNKIVRGLIWFHNNLSAREMVIFMSLSWTALCAVIMLLVFSDTNVVRAFYRRLSVISPGRLLGLRMTQDLALAAVIMALLLATSGISGLRKLERERKGIDAVVVQEEISVYSSPTDDATLQFKIHSGTVVDIVERRPDWVRIRLPGELSGWVASKTIEAV